MGVVIALNYPAAVPAGHTVEVTEFVDTRPERKRLRRPDFAEPAGCPVVLDLDTGIRYMNHAHASRLTNGGMAAVGRAYPLEPLADLPVRRVYRARVLACTLVMIEAYDNQHTSLLVEPLEPLE